MTKVIGMDPSLNGFAVAYRLGETIVANRISVGSRRGVQRLAYLEERVAWLLDKVQPDFVAYEDYAMGFRGKTNAIFNIGELGGVIKLLISRKGIDILMVPPTTMKLFITGKGGGKSSESKKRVAAAIQSQYGLQFRNSDEYDAAGLLLVGEGYANPMTLPRSRVHYKRRALEGCSLVEN